jgi:hypothetical protein
MPMAKKRHNTDVMNFRDDTAAPSIASLVGNFGKNELEAGVKIERKVKYCGSSYTYTSSAR